MRLLFFKFSPAAFPFLRKCAYRETLQRAAETKNRKNPESVIGLFFNSLFRTRTGAIARKPCCVSFSALPECAHRGTIICTIWNTLWPKFVTHRPGRLERWISATVILLCKRAFFSAHMAHGMPIANRQCVRKGCGRRKRDLKAVRLEGGIESSGGILSRGQPDCKFLGGSGSAGFPFLFSPGMRSRTFPSREYSAPRTGLILR